MENKREFIKYYEIALKSANETIYWLCLLKDSKLVKKVKIEKVKGFNLFAKLI